MTTHDCLRIPSGSATTRLATKWIKGAGWRKPELAPKPFEQVWPYFCITRTEVISVARASSSPCEVLGNGRVFE